MHKSKTKGHVSRPLLNKGLLVIFIIALVVFIVFYTRNYLQTIKAEKNRAQAQLATLSQQLEVVHQQVHSVNNNQVDVQNYTTSQVKDAYLLVRTAATSLQHDQDVVVAKQLLQLAAEHLANIHGPKIEQAKSAIAADQAKLNAVITPDTTAIQDKLTILDKLISIMPAYKASTEQVTPLQQTTKNKVHPANPPAWYQPICNFFSDLKSVVKVRKKTDYEMNVSDLDVARAQFKLIIEQLRWAAFYNNNEVYQRSIKNAQELLPKLFDMNSESVQKFATTLQELQKMQLRTEVPSIQNSVNALQSILGG